MGPFSAVRCVPKAQYFLVLQQCQWLGAIGKWGSRVVFILGDSQSEVWEKMGNISLVSLARYLRKLEEFGSSPVYRYITKAQRQLTGLESNVYRGANIIFLSTITPTFPQR